VEDISFSAGEQGGYKEVVFSITGDDVYRELRYESGGHRVQRVPKTEQQARIHTSAATVAILPEPDEVQVEIRDQDIEWSACGPGRRRSTRQQDRECRPHLVQARHAGGVRGQVPGRAQASTRTTTEPSASSAAGCTSGSSNNCTASAPSNGGPLIGSGDRSERIRTYNFPQNRVTDHRINLNLYKLDAIIAGSLGE